ncbi:LacI family DNA-binding transcriptional regulator [Kitasatospora sp. RG8]|uniref:LacI family DNA-binding transcriptional regulator n=1 Tax=Kitasatospora sp. RG8 TaxID=2820815 RepID=UPI001ADF2734|nr:LacI family DNA-binding transcriptional regulator [Kitasatospora sp. RG8]MBP0454634.1 LacI family DNA-binding transcriptional regulator [Kitasatospora sp. RG8]
MSNPRSTTRAKRSTGAVTLQRVAEHAGVSIATASRVLHGGPRTVGEELRHKVEGAARELGYVSNAPAQALARSSTSVVGLLVHDIADPYFSAIAAGAMRAAKRHRLMVMIAATAGDPELEIEYVRGLRAQRARALVIAGSGSVDRDLTQRFTAELDAFRSDGGQVACIGERGIEPFVPLDHGGGAEIAATELWRLGHRRIGVVAGPAGLLTVHRRLAGIRAAWARLGGELPDSRVVFTDFTRSGGREATLGLFAADAGVTAVLALSDVMAAGVLTALQDDLGRAVPEEVSVIGFDDVPFAVDLRPSLTTVRLPLEEAGERAVQLIADGASPARQAPLGVALVARGSTAPAGGAGGE